MAVTASKRTERIPPLPAPPARIILATDGGNDVDDVLALPQ
jgi:hypothetical protein